MCSESSYAWGERRLPIMEAKPACARSSFDLVPARCNPHLHSAESQSPYKRLSLEPPGVQCTHLVGARHIKGVLDANSNGGPYQPD